MTKYISNTKVLKLNTIANVKVGDCFCYNGMDYIRYGGGDTDYLRLEDKINGCQFTTLTIGVEIYQTVELKNPQ